MFLKAEFELSQLRLEEESVEVTGIVHLVGLFLQGALAKSISCFWDSSLCRLFSEQRRKIHPKKSTQNIKGSSEQVFLNKFCWVPDLCHREEGQSSCELFAKVRVHTAFFGISGFCGLWASICPNRRGHRKAMLLACCVSLVGLLKLTTSVQTPVTSSCGDCASFPVFLPFPLPMFS